jgi:hypothetical protein
MHGIPKPRPKVTVTKPEDILARHVFTAGASYACRRCGKWQSDILANALPCISEVRAAGNAAIGRITSR